MWFTWRAGIPTETSSLPRHHLAICKRSVKTSARRSLPERTYQVKELGKHGLFECPVSRRLRRPRRLLPACVRCYCDGPARASSGSSGNPTRRKRAVLPKTSTPKEQLMTFHLSMLTANGVSTGCLPSGVIKVPTAHRRPQPPVSRHRGCGNHGALADHHLHHQRSHYGAINVNSDKPLIDSATINTEHSTILTWKL